MNASLHIDFSSMPWEPLGPGARQKSLVHDGQQLRLVEFSDAFVEEHWCIRGHKGYVVRGQMRVNFNGRMQHYVQGDGLWIPEGEATRHKVVMEPGTTVELLLFESAVAR